MHRSTIIKIASVILLILIAGVVCYVLFGGEKNPADPEIPPAASLHYDYQKLYEYKNIQNTAEVTELLGFLQTANDLSIDGAYLSEDALDVRFILNLGPGEEYHVNSTTEMQDMVILFALIENLDRISFIYTQEAYGLVAPVFRANANDVFAGDIASGAQTKELFAGHFAEQVEDLFYNPDVKSVVSYDIDIAGSKD
ncbi:MAG: hypothetical protein FWF85_07555 [Clostridiales bacterium]|nr:hypothetical protein [Clostridiales bacterium]